ncbi:MAG: methylmalonyl Co-A mutase-associated GTPase MeaB [Myxococcota bacterium]
MTTTPLSRPDWLARALNGDRRALARCITWIESHDVALSEPLGAMRVHRREGPGQPHVIGVTGPPGAGKSTLVNQWIRSLRDQGRTVAVLAIDPSSPFSGGAILGDRIRMEQHTADPGVYIRSLSSRGHLGGLSASTAEVVDLLDGVGFDVVLLETVGVGQSELTVMEVADTVAVVLTPESGDAIQAMKAGLMEIADVFVVNKSDRPGADRWVRELEHAVRLSERPYKPPVLRVVATEGQGIAELVACAEAHLGWCKAEGNPTWQRRRGDAAVRLTLDRVAHAARRRARQTLHSEHIEEDLRAGRISPQDAARRLS